MDDEAQPVEVEIEDAILTLSSASKSFGKRTVLDNICLSLGRYEIVGLVGPNGAGKTTLLNILSGFLHLSSGQMRITIEAAVPCPVLFLQDVPAFSSRTSGFECLSLACALAGMDVSRETISDALKTVGLARDASSTATSMSMGMQKRLQWAHALLLKPDILLLDEPSAFLDPPGVLALRRFLASERDRGCAVLMSSHNVHEVARLSNRIYMMTRGSLAEIPSWTANDSADLEKYFYTTGDFNE